MSKDCSAVVGLENEFSVGADGWVKIAPYGDHRKERTVRDAGGTRTEVFLQRLDRASAEEMARKFNSPLSKAKRFVLGIPIFKHHPDLATHAPGTVSSFANDTREYGMFAELEARADGFYGRPVMSTAGREAIEREGLKFLSPFWWARFVGEAANRMKIVSPFELISAGLTATPNIEGGQALANAKETKHMTKTNDLLDRVHRLMDVRKLDYLTAYRQAEMEMALVDAGVPLCNDAAEDKRVAATHSSASAGVMTPGKAVLSGRDQLDWIELNQQLASGQRSALTLDQAEFAMSDLTQRLMNRRSMSYSEAWAEAMRLIPEVYAILVAASGTQNR